MCINIDHTTSDNRYTDQEFIQQTITIIDQLTMLIPKQIIGIKNTEFKHLYISKHFANLMGRAQEEVIGTTKLATDDEAVIKLVQQEDTEVMTKRITRSCLKINSFTDGLKPRIIIKTPLINPTTDNVVGVLYQGFESVLASSFSTQLTKLQNIFCQRSSINRSNIKLTKREKQVIFFFLSHLGSEQIANAIYKLEAKKVSKSTIDSLFLDQLYVKFAVTNRVDLYNKLLYLGYDRLIPKEVIVNSVLPLHNSEIY